MDGTFDDLLSDSDDEDSDKIGKAEQRAELLIAKVASREGCSYPAAMQMILNNPKMMEKAGVSRSKMKYFSLDTHLGREKFKRKLFEKTINGIGYQQELRNVLQLYFGNNINLQSIIKNWSSYEWPDEILLLFIFQIGEFEMDKLQDRAKSKGTKFEEAQLKFLIRERQLMKYVFIDHLFLNKNKDLRGYVLNTLEYVLNRERNTRNRVFSALYVKDRGTLVSDSDKVKENYIFNYNSKVKKLKGRISRPLVSMGSSCNNGNHNNNGNQFNNGTIEKKPICDYFNSTKGCQFGKRCNKDNICVECKNEKHGAPFCYKIGRFMIDRGIIRKIMERRPGVSRHDPQNGVVIGCDGRNYYLNRPSNNDNFGNWNNNNNNNNNRNNNNGNRNN